MAGEHILKLLADTNAIIEYDYKWMVVNILLGSQATHFYVYEKLPHKRNTCVLIETQDEEKACRILK